MQSTVAFKNAYAALDHLLPPADAKHSDQAAQVTREDQVLKRLGVLARSAELHAAAEAVEVLMNVAARGATPTALADRAVRVLSTLHDDAKAPAHVKAAIRQQALSLRDYTPATSALPAALKSMAAQALQDEAAKVLHQRFKADTEAMRARYAGAAASTPARKPQESAEPAPARAMTPQAVEQALGGLSRVSVVPQVLTVSRYAPPAENPALEAAVATLISRGIQYEEGEALDAPVKPGVLFLKLAGNPGEADRWVSVWAVPSSDKPGRQDILLLYSGEGRDARGSLDLAQWLRDALGASVGHVAVAGVVDRPRSMPDDGGLFLALVARHLDQALGNDPSHQARQTGAVKCWLDEAVIDWGKLSRAHQHAALATLPGVQDAGSSAPASNRLTAAPAGAWWMRG